jgi:hypothetical protein
MGWAMSRLLRGVIDYGGSITPEYLRKNWDALRAVREAGLEWGRPDYHNVEKFLKGYVETYGAAPSYETVRVHFVREAHPDWKEGEREPFSEELAVLDEIENRARKEPWLPWPNYQWFCNEEREKCLGNRAAEAFKLARQIVFKGAEVNGKKLKGLPAAREYVLSELQALSDPKAKTARTVEHVGPLEIFAEQGPIPWICQGLRMAPGTGPYMIGGYGFSGKTMAAQDMALAIASGSPIWGQFECKPGRALHLDHEQGRYLTRDRYQRLARARGLDVRKLIADDRLRLSVFPSITLDDEEAEEILTALFAEFDFVLIDSFGSACPSLEESSPQARIPLDLVSRACGEKTTALVLHHARKPTKDAPAGGKYSLRGSGNIFAALGGCFIFHGDGDDKNGPINVQHERERWRGVTMEDFAIRIRDVEGDGDDHWGVAVEHLDAAALSEVREQAGEKTRDKTAQKITAYLKNQSDCTFEGSRGDLCKAVGVNKAKGLEALRGMVAAGKLRTESKPARIILSDGDGVAEALRGALYDA